MIDYDYLIERDEGGETNRVFKPNSRLSKLPNIVYIEGPNSSGKSTLLHLLALSCYGLKNKRIKKSLIEKMDNLINSDHQQIKFSVKVTNKDGETEFTVEKKNLKGTDIVLRDRKNEIISYDRFEKEYNLIYDIPEDPTKRLAELTHEIRDFQLWFQKKLGFLRSHLVKVVSDIREGKDPQNIERNRNQKKDLEDQQHKAIENIKQASDELKSVRMYSCLRFYMENKQALDKLKMCVKDAAREDGKAKKQKLQATQECINLQKQLEDEAVRLEELHYEITPTLVQLFQDQEKNKLKLWKDVDVRKELHEPEVKQVLKFEASYFKQLIEKTLDKEKKDDNLQQAEFLRALFKVIEDYSGVEMKIPGIELTLAKFKEILKKETKKYDDLIGRVKTLDATVNKLEEILTKRKYIVEELIPELKLAIKKSDGVKVYDDTEEYKQQKMNERLREIEDNMNYYKEECIKANIPEKDITSLYQSIILGKALRKYEQLSEVQLKDKVFGFEQYISEENSRLRKIEAALDYTAKEIERLEKKEEHPYLKHLSFLEKTLQEVRAMEQKVNDFDDFIRLIIDKAAMQDGFKSITETEPQKKYYDHVFTYLAMRVGSIRHIDQDFKPTYIDLIKNVILTKCGKKIKIADMGTGQSQSAFLKGLLSANDGRKMIALFDEVAMLDSSSLNPIKRQVRELFEQGRLLVGIIVQKAEQLKVEPITT